MNNIYDLIKKSAILHPSRDALTLRDKTCSYDEFVDEINVCAARLDNIVNKGERVAIYADKSIQSIILIFATMKIGCIVVLLNPLLKRQQIRHMLNRCIVF